MRGCEGKGPTAPSDAVMKDWAMEGAVPAAPRDAGKPGSPMVEVGGKPW